MHDRPAMRYNRHFHANVREQLPAPGAARDDNRVGDVSAFGGHRAPNASAVNGQSLHLLTNDADPEVPSREPSVQKAAVDTGRALVA
jgi:hypothetical protein